MALARYESVAVNLAGDVIPNATVEVREDRPGRPVVPLWADRNGTVPLGNPITTDSEGKFGFHVTGGSFYIRVFTGPSQQPLQQYVRRYQAIGTAAERDVEDLATALEAGTATFPTLADLEVFIPTAEGVGGKVTTGPDAGFYHYDDVAVEWVFDRPLYDTLARMNVTGGTADAIEAEIASGVADSAVVMLWIEAPGDNTGAVTINGKEVLTAGGNSLIAGQWNEGRTYWFSDEGAIYKLRTESDVDGIATQVEIWANETLNNKNYAEEWAQSDDPISVEAGGDGVNDKSAKSWAVQASDDVAAGVLHAEEWAQSDAPISVEAGGDGVNDKSSKAWAGEADASAAEAAGYAAGVNLPAIVPGDSGKQLFVRASEDGYDVGGYIPGPGIAIDNTDPTAPVISALAQQSALQGANIYQITGNLKHKGLTVQIFPTSVSDGPGSQGNKKWVIIWREGVAHGYDGNSVVKAADSYDQGKSLQNIRTIYNEAAVDARDFSGATMDGGRIGMLVTRELGASSYGKPMFLYSDDEGVTWSSSVLTTMADGLSFDEYLHNIPAGFGGGSDSWIAYGWVNPTRTTIQYARTDDNGATWTSGTAVAMVSGEDWSEPRVARLGSADQWIMVIRRNQSEGLNAFISKSSDMLTWSVPIDSGQEVGRNCMTLLAQGDDLHWFVFSRSYATAAMSIEGRRDGLLVQSRKFDDVWTTLDGWEGWETFATMFRPLGYMKFVVDSGKTYGVLSYNENEVGDGASYTALAILTDDPTFLQKGAMSGGGGNGNWIAYPDGRLECYGTITTAITCVAYAGLFLSESKHQVYPCNAAIKFASQPTTLTRVRSSSARAWPTASGDPIDQVLNLSLQFLSPVATTAQSVTFDYHAVGKWS